MNLISLPLVFMGGDRIAETIVTVYDWHRREIGVIALVLLTIFMLLFGATYSSIIRVRRAYLERRLRTSGSRHRARFDAVLMFLATFTSFRITLPLYLSTLLTYVVFGGSVIMVFGTADILVELQGLDTKPQDVGVVFFWLTGPIGKGILTVLLALLTLIVMIMTLLLATGLLIGAGRRLHVSHSAPLTTVDFVLSLLETFIPARIMNEDGGDLREKIERFGEAGASLLRLYGHFTVGILWILLNAAREALSLRRKRHR